MPSTAANLISSVCRLKFMSIALKLVWSDKLVGSRLYVTEECSVFRDLDIDSECNESVSGRAGLTNERSLRILFRSVTTSIERMSYKGLVMYNARNRGSSGLSGWRAAFWG